MFNLSNFILAFKSHAKLVTPFLLVRAKLKGLYSLLAFVSSSSYVFSCSILAVFRYFILDMLVILSPSEHRTEGYRTLFCFPLAFVSTSVRLPMFNLSSF